ncbi:MAG TPA: class I SAM-dependent methyltransferase [Candidatus Binataceae bacterium]|nr:class I SAM-dependent methyltransferase [Candidatus Binataceae bacterium]
MVTRYSAEFYSGQQKGSRRSAEQVVPLVLDLIPAPSVADVGCGVGTWLATFAANGVKQIRGIDGDYVDRSQLQIPADRFLPYDLAKPIKLDERFDLVLCLEVAEHLDQADAPTLINSLVHLGPRVLFSAAIPYQGGTRHVNEQWPVYWAKLFARHGYKPIDYLRRLIWQSDQVEWWYAQNLLLFIDQDVLRSDKRLLKEYREEPPLSLVHPKHYQQVVLTSRLPREVASIVSERTSFILVDDNRFGPDPVPARRALPFLERDGRPWGKPLDDATAIRELERMRTAGADAVVFAWPSFWWLNYYSEFQRYLRSRFPCVRENDCIIAFDLS